MAFIRSQNNGLKRGMGATIRASGAVGMFFYDKLVHFVIIHHYNFSAFSIYIILQSKNILKKRATASAREDSKAELQHGSNH